MRKKRWMVLGCAAAAMVMVSGCGSGKTETTTAAAVQESSVQEEVRQESEETNLRMTVMVTSVNGNTVTADTGEIKSMEPGAGQHGPGGEGQKGNKPGGGAETGDQKGGRPEGGGAEAGDQKGGRPEGGGSGADDRKGGGQDGKQPEGNGAGEGQKSGGQDRKQPEGGKPDGGMPGKSSPGGEAPADKPQGGSEGQGGAGGPGRSGGSIFEAAGGSITFTLTDDTAVTVEFLQGSGEGTIEDIVPGSVLEVTLDSGNCALEVVVKNLNAGGGFGGSGEVTHGTSVKILNEDTSISGETYTSDGDDENALRADGASVTLDGVTIEKSGGSSSNTEDGDFYGQNAAFLAINGAQVTITNATVNTSAVNGNGIFSYGEGTVVNISDSVIRTTERNSGGIQTTGGGTTNAANLDIETQGNSAAAIRSDRGGGTVNVSGGTYVTNGTGSPAVYCTADITVSDAVLTANASEGIVVEGKNSVSLKNCDVTGNMSNTYNGDSEENIHAIMIYQSMSGDAELGEAYFSAEGGSITSKVGDLFYITNTDCEITLKNVSLQLANDILLRIEGNTSSRGWGTQGANGGDVILTADSQKLTGNILVDEISSLSLTMSNGTEFDGAINPDGEGGTVDVVLESGSVWSLTGDSYISSFTGNVEDITANGFHL